MYINFKISEYMFFIKINFWFFNGFDIFIVFFWFCLLNYFLLKLKVDIYIYSWYVGLCS